jgi:hypothetical protein
VRAVPVGSTAMPKIGAALNAVFILATPGSAWAQAQTCPGARYSDSHFHLTNYIQEGTRLQDYLNMMGSTVCRSTVFGIPLTIFPGVFSGIGEFSIHKEFVSAKVAGGNATLTDQALHRILDFAGEVGLVVILHSDADVPFPRPGQEPYQLKQLGELFRDHPKTKIIWAHVGLGRVVRPVKDQLAIMDKALGDPSLSHVNIDISWDETAKYIAGSPEALEASAALINKYPDRFLFGSDVVAPSSIDAPMAVYNLYEPLWAKLSPEVSRKVRLGNYERLFDAARLSVRAWEKANTK